MNVEYEIEEITISDNKMKHNAASRIFQQDGAMLVAVGSLACVRTLWFQAYRLGKLKQFCGCALRAWDYALGKNDEVIHEKIRKAQEQPDAKGIIVYASCMEYLTQWEWNSENTQLESKIPIGILFRGPLTKRCRNPIIDLDALLKEMGLQEKNREQIIQIEESDLGLYSLPPVAPDFSGVLSFLSEIEADAVLVSPGGCKSCVEYVDDSTEVLHKCKQYGTRFSDVSVTGGCEDGLTMSLCQKFENKRALFLVGSAVMNMIGFDGKYLEQRLAEYGKHALFFDCNGFEGCPEAVDHAMLEIGKICFRNVNPCSERRVLITGYTELAVGEKRVLEPVISRLRQSNMTVEYLGQNWNQEESQLPAVIWMVSGEGYSISKWMQEEYGIPCVAGRNLGEICADELAEEILSYVDQLCKTDKDDFSKIVEEKPEIDKKPLWILGEPVLTISLYDYYIQKNPGKTIKPAVYVPTPGMRRTYQKLFEILGITDIGWSYFETQEEIADCIHTGTIIADEFIIRFLQKRHPDIEGIPVKFPEISGEISYNT
ncbi:MAG: hypothetical protein ACI4EI_06390 [Muricoprocola sp.]